MTSKVKKVLIWKFFYLERSIGLWLVQSKSPSEKCVSQILHKTNGTRYIRKVRRQQRSDLNHFSKNRKFFYDSKLMEDWKELHQYLKLFKKWWLRNKKIYWANKVHNNSKVAEEWWKPWIWWALYFRCI
jgi:hypothetical protein